MIDIPPIEKATPEEIHQFQDDQLQEFTYLKSFIGRSFDFIVSKIIIYSVMV